MTTADTQAAVEPEDGWSGPLCEQCTWPDPDTTKGRYHSWRCRAVPKYVNWQWVVKEALLTEPPYERCAVINGFGQCRFFEQRKEENDGEHD